MASSEVSRTTEEGLYYHELFKSNCMRFFDFLRMLFDGTAIHDILELKERISLKSRYPPNGRSEYFLGKKKPLVSVVIPTRNEESCIPRLLLSIRKNSYKNVEIIVSDYKSSDGTVEIAKSFGAKAVRLDRPGIGYASHVGTTNCRGKIVIRTDADAQFPRNLILETVHHFVHSRETCVYHVSRYYYDAGIYLNFLGYLYDKYWRKPWNTSGHFIAFRRSAYETIGGFDSNLFGNEDFDFGQRAYSRLGEKGVVFDLNPVILVSARRVKLTGFTQYLMGKRRR